MLCAGIEDALLFKKLQRRGEKNRARLPKIKNKYQTPSKEASNQEASKKPQKCQRSRRSRSATSKKGNGKNVKQKPRKKPGVKGKKGAHPNA
jgi:hypothetical protein